MRVPIAYQNFQEKATLMGHILFQFKKKKDYAFFENFSVRLLLVLG